MILAQVTRWNINNNVFFPRSASTGVFFVLLTFFFVYRSRSRFIGIANTDNVLNWIAWQFIFLVLSSWKKNQNNSTIIHTSFFKATIENQRSELHFQTEFIRVIRIWIHECNRELNTVVWVENDKEYLSMLDSGMKFNAHRLNRKIPRRTRTFILIFIKLINTKYFLDD